MKKPILKIYAVRNKEGLYFRAKGMNGYGPSWVEEIEKARTYTKPGPAKGVITWFAKNHPTFGVPDLIELHVNKIVVIDQGERVAKVKVEHQIKENQNRLSYLQRMQKSKATEIENSKEELTLLQEELDRLKKSS